MQSQIITGNSQYFPRRQSYFLGHPYASSYQSPSRRERSRSPQLANRSTLNNNSMGLNVGTDGMKKMIEEMTMYPAGFAQLLKNEDRYVKAFKLQINKEKEKVDEDLSSFKVELNHTLEDLRLSLHAHLDLVYRAYLDKTAKFRSQLFEINRLKEQLEIELGASSLAELQSKMKMDKQNVSKLRAEKDTEVQGLSEMQKQQQANNSLQMQTLQTISNMEVGNQELRKYYILNYISQIQRERAAPLTDLQKELVLLNSYESGFYQPKEFLRMLGHLRDVFSKETRAVYDKNYLYIRNIDDLLIKQKERDNKILEGFDLTHNPNVSVQATGSFVPVRLQPAYQPMRRSQIIGLNGTISPSEQSLRVNKVENIGLVEEPVNIQMPTSMGSKTGLCGIYINNQIAMGLKDGLIQVVSCDGHSIATLKEHKAGICALAVIRTKAQNYLVSGSDVGCCKTVVWDPVTWQPKHIFVAHQAAVTGLVDLQDDGQFLSAGYDRKLNIYNLEQGRVVQAALTDCPMTSILTNKTASKLVGCGLDKAIYVWQIVRDYRLRVQGLVLQRKIQNNATISSMVASQLLPELVVIATKDCKIKLVNIDKGESYKTVTLGDEPEGSLSTAYPLEICIVERENKGYYPIVLVWPYKESKLYQVNTENGLITVKGLSAGCGTLEYGYGVNPKCFYVPDTGRGTLVYSINQRPSNPKESCLSVHRLEELR